MKEIKNTVIYYKNRLKALILKDVLFTSTMLIFAIISLIKRLTLWCTLMCFGLTIVGIVLLIFIIKYSRKKIKTLEQEFGELEKAEKQQTNTIKT
ncbi:MAG: hypothetical protein ACI4MQ_01490 [Candidatus Coproplasma sp.]